MALPSIMLPVMASAVLKLAIVVEPKRSAVFQITAKRVLAGVTATSRPKALMSPEDHGVIQTLSL